MGQERFTVYSKEDCVQCTATLRKLDSGNYEYDVIELDSNEEAIEEIKEMGHLRAPVVEINGENWSGFRPDLIEKFGETALSKLVSLDVET